MLGFKSCFETNKKTGFVPHEQLEMSWCVVLTIQWFKKCKCESTVMNSGHQLDTWLGFGKYAVNIQPFCPYVFQFCWHNNIRKTSWFLYKNSHILSRQKRLEMSWFLINKIRFCCNKHDWINFLTLHLKHSIMSWNPKHLVVDGCMWGLNLITSFRSVSSHLEKMICRILLFFYLASCG